MTTPNDPQPQPQPEPTPEPQRPEPVLASQNLEDADYAALVALEKEIETGTPAAPDGTAAPATQPEPQPEPAPVAEPGAQPQPQQAADQHMIPKPRFDEVLEENRQKDAMIARLQGRLEAAEIFRQTAAAPVATQAPAPAEVPQTPEQRISAIEAKRIELANQYDAGDITLAQYREQDLVLERDIRTIDREVTLAQMPKAAAGPSTDLYRESKLDEIEAAHRYINLIPDNHPGWDLMEKQATADLTAKLGRPLDPNNPSDDLAWRNRIAELSDVYGPIWVANAPPAPKAATPPTDGRQPAPTAQPKPQQPSPQQRDAKLTLANDLPPDISQMGGRHEGTDLWTPDRVANLTEEEFEALPAATRATIQSRFGDSPQPRTI